MREDGGPTWRNTTELQLSGGLCRPCHLGTAQTDAAWAPAARHLRAALPCQPRRCGCRKETRRGLRARTPAWALLLPKSLHFEVIFLKLNFMTSYGPRTTVRSYTLTSLGCAAIFCCFAFESNEVVREILNSGQVFPGPPGLGMR